MKLTNYETVVVYKQDKQKAVVKYVNTTSNVDLAKDELEGSSGALIDYSTADRITTYKKAGYKLIEDGFTNAADKHYDSNPSVDQEFVVSLEERIEPVTPQDPKPVPGIPVTPEDPANWPEEVKDMKELERTATQTIRFREEESGKEVFKTITRKITFERTAYVNLVTGNITYSSWRIGKVVDVDAPVQPVNGAAATGDAVANRRVARSLPAEYEVASTEDYEDLPVESPTPVAEEPRPSATVEASVERLPEEPVATPVAPQPEVSTEASPKPVAPTTAIRVNTPKATATVTNPVYTGKRVLTRGRYSRRPPKI